jgi:hypothetical protein
MTVSKRSMASDTARIAGLFAARIAAAKEELRGRMEAAGLAARDGWRIHEELVGLPEGTAIHLWPVHRERTAPDDLHVIVPLS